MQLVLSYRAWNDRTVNWAGQPGYGVRTGSLEDQHATRKSAVLHSHCHISPGNLEVKVKVKVKWIYIAPSRETSKALRHGSHSVTCNHTICLPLPRKHSSDGASPDWGCEHLIAAYSSFIYPGWLTYSGRFTHISGHPSAAARAQDRESSPVKDQRSTTVPRNQPLYMSADIVTYDDDGGRRSYPVHSAKQSSSSNCRHDTGIHPPPRTSRIRRSTDWLPDIAETNANGTPVQTARHSDHVTMSHAHETVQLRYVRSK